MDKNGNKITKEAIAAYLSAKKEEQFSATELLQEIAPLLEDYFMVESTVDKQAVTLSFWNGQTFRLSIEKSVS